MQSHPDFPHLPAAAVTKHSQPGFPAGICGHRAGLGIPAVPPCLPERPVRVATTGQPLSVDGQADVGMLVVEQPGHRHRLIALAKHLFLDAGRSEVTDEILKRLQAATQH